MDTVVNYHSLILALEYYTALGYERIEVPWAVKRSTIDITARGRLAPVLRRDGMAEISDHASEASYIVGSGEQGFLELELNPDTQLAPGKYCTLTPCFRPGDVDGAFHQEWFMKVELFRTDVIDRDAVDEMIWDATVFMQQDLRAHDYHIERFDTPEENIMIPHLKTGTIFSADLNLNGIEVGSYGIRTCPDLDWVYGTGLAEPRYSQAIEQYGIFRERFPDKFLVAS